MKSMVRLSSKILPESSLLIFDCGGNTKTVKQKILAARLNYLTLKAKHKSAYSALLKVFRESEKQLVELKGSTYECVKITSEKECVYVFYSQKLS